MQWNRHWRLSSSLTTFFTLSPSADTTYRWPPENTLISRVYIFWIETKSNHCNITAHVYFLYCTFFVFLHCKCCTLLWILTVFILFYIQGYLLLKHNYYMLNSFAVSTHAAVMHVLFSVNVFSLCTALDQVQVPPSASASWTFSFLLLFLTSWFVSWGNPVHAEWQVCVYCDFIF